MVARVENGLGVDRSHFPPIEDYAFLSDCETTALVAPDGAVEWLCLPRMDSPSVFGAVLDRDAGRFRIGPAGLDVPSARRYIPGTMVLETSWWTPGGWLVVTDALLIGPWHHQGERSMTHRRAPTDYDAAHVLLRMLRCVNGQVQVDMDCTPAFDYGRLPARWSYAGDGYNEAIAEPVLRRRAGDEQAGAEPLPRLRMTTDLNVGFEGPTATARTLLKEGERRFVALWWSNHAPPATLRDARRQLRWTCRHWQHWLDRGTFPDHPWRGHLQRSALTLKGLSFAPSGAIIAAATTSLPETLGGERNWDYRYTWIRDTAKTLWALNSLGLDWEANDFFRFVAEVAGAEDTDLQLMYGVGGERALHETTLDHLSGYEGARPVRMATAHMTNASTTYGARSCARSTFIRVRTAGSRIDCGGSSKPRSNLRCSTGENPTKASGRCARVRNTSPSRKWRAGWLPTQVRESRQCAARRTWLPDGAPLPRTSAPMYWQTRSTSVVCSPSTTTPRPSTPRCCSSRWWDSCRPAMSESAIPCCASPTS